MVELDLFPIFLHMASLTLGAELALMHLVVVFLMARVAQLRRFFVFLVEVALVALHILMLAQQREVGLAVIEARRLPILFAMALLALITQLALVRLVVIFLMAGNASLGRVLEFVVDVALHALHINVLAQ